MRTEFIECELSLSDLSCGVQVSNDRLHSDLAFELGRAVRELRERRGWSQSQLAHASGMTQSAVARFEAGGTVPTLPVLERLASALDVGLSVKFEPRGAAA